ncbi:MAG: hypothetical protein M3467_05730 [Actinomycetota bacterium]|nr:hypothetical protein [Actinomycetota bacterium]
MTRSELPEVTYDAVNGLKFSDVLPAELARHTMALRLAEPAAAAQVLGEPRVWQVAAPSR